LSLCDCEHEGNFCTQEENHLGICGDGEVVWFCRDRDDYPHGSVEPEDPWEGPNKSRHVRQGPKKTLGDYIRTKRDLSLKKVQEVLRRHPDLELPEWLPEALRSPRSPHQPQGLVRGRVGRKGSVEGLSGPQGEE